MDGFNESVNHDSAPVMGVCGDPEKLFFGTQVRPNEVDRRTLFYDDSIQLHPFGPHPERQPLPPYYLQGCRKVRPRVSAWASVMSSGHLLPHRFRLSVTTPLGFRIPGRGRDTDETSLTTTIHPSGFSSDWDARDKGSTNGTTVSRLDPDERDPRTLRFPKEGRHVLLSYIVLPDQEEKEKSRTSKTGGWKRVNNRRRRLEGNFYRTKKRGTGLGR